MSIGASSSSRSGRAARRKSQTAAPAGTSSPVTLTRKSPTTNAPNSRVSSRPTSKSNSRTASPKPGARETMEEEEEKPLSVDEIVQGLYNEFISELCIDKIFELHRQFYSPTGAHDRTLDATSDIFGQRPSRIPDVPFKCSNCGRPITVSKYAPHLEKCTGKGRSSSRQARQRVLNQSRPVDYSMKEDEMLVDEADGGDSDFAKSKSNLSKLRK